MTVVKNRQVFSPSCIGKGTAALITKAHQAHTGRAIILLVALSEPEVLHLPTLLLVAALVVGFTGGLLISARGTTGDHHALGLWGGAMLLGAFGLTLEALPGPANIIGSLGTTLFLVATGLSWTAARKFAERRPKLVLAAAGPAVWVVSSIFGFSPDSLAAAACLVGGTYTLATSMELLKTRPEPLTSRGPALALIVLHGTIYMGRGIATAPALGGAAASVNSSPLVDCFIIEALLHTVGMAFLLLAMVKERTEIRATDRLRDLASLDGLTGIANRRKFDEHLASEVSRAQRQGSPVALLMIDIDHFKRLNDTFGHQHGDDCLRKVAAALVGFARRSGDIVARYGGEEFAIVLAGTPLEAACQIAERVRHTVAALAIPGPGGQSGTISIGVASRAARGRSWTPLHLLSDADQALYRAKAAGRNTVCWGVTGDVGVTGPERMSSALSPGRVCGPDTSPACARDST